MRFIFLMFNLLVMWEPATSKLIMGNTTDVEISTHKVVYNRCHLWNLLNAYIH